MPVDLVSELKGKREKGEGRREKGEGRRAFNMSITVKQIRLVLSQTTRTKKKEKRKRKEKKVKPSAFAANSETWGSLPGKTIRR